jgi:hypothetical protein
VKRADAKSKVAGKTREISFYGLLAPKYKKISMKEILYGLRDKEDRI